MQREQVVIVIPAYNPDEKFLSFLNDLNSEGYIHIIVVDDGSQIENQYYFDVAEDKYHCHILRHNINLGQGRAYKTAFNYYLGESKAGGHYEETIGIIQCDCDGQHCVEDIQRCMELLTDNPDKFILGVRDFSDKSIPFRSRFGNKCTEMIFKLFCGLDVTDTQSGLKGIPKSFIPVIMETPGERFEYASSVLLETREQRIEIIQFPIKTIYINGNETSHFRPLIDSIRIYSLILKYLMSSLSAFIIDIIAFSVFLVLFKGAGEGYIVISTYLAKFISCSYTFFVNKCVVFRGAKRSGKTAVKFLLLCVLQASLSGILVSTFVYLSVLNEVVCKVIVDIILFFFSFQVQSRWVFK